MATPLAQSIHSSGPLSNDEVALWRGFLGWSESITSNVGRDLTAATGLTGPEFEILVRLSEAPENALEQRVLAESLGWSASRMSHQLARMTTRGLLSRAEVGVGRLMRIALTREGTATVKQSLGVHAEAVRRHFLERLPPAHRAELLNAECAHDGSRMH